ncbi:MAG TPA: hypothetical protein VLD57_01100 [Blastocatellia bacterium]|nr:hypothetical protein [Blastocatellia bacterium]
MTVLLAIGAGVILTAIAVAIGGFALKAILTAINRSLQQSEVATQSPSEWLVIDRHRTDNNLGAMDWGGKKVVA